MKSSLLTDDEDLYNALSRALKISSDIKLCYYEERIKRRTIVIYAKFDVNTFDKWFWSEFRKKKLNPLIVIGIEKKDKFHRDHPVFQMYMDEHMYVQVPFELIDLVTAIKRIQPIHDEVTRRLMVKEYSTGYEYKLITHDLKIVKGNKIATKDLFEKVKDYYQSTGDKVSSMLLEDQIKTIASKKAWEPVALKAKAVLIERLKAPKLR